MADILASARFPAEMDREAARKVLAHCWACRSAEMPSELRSRLLCKTWEGCRQVCAGGSVVWCSRIDC